MRLVFKCAGASLVVLASGLISLNYWSLIHIRPLILLFPPLCCSLNSEVVVKELLVFGFTNSAVDPVRLQSTFFLFFHFHVFASTGCELSVDEFWSSCIWWSCFCFNIVGLSLFLGGMLFLFSFFFLQVWTWSSQVLGPILWRYPFILDWRVRWWLRLGHRRIVSGPRDFRQEQGARGHSRTLGHARSFGLRYTRASGQERRPIRRVGMVQGRFSDLLGRRPWLLGQSVLGPCSEHSCHLGVSGGAHGRSRGLSRCRRTTGWSYRSNLPRRLLRSLGLGWRPWHFRWAEGEGVEERKTGHVLHVWILRAGHRHWQGPIGQFERSSGRPSCQQCLGLCHQLHPRILD